MLIRTLLLCLCAQSLYGQSITHFSTKDGLSENYINSIYQDSLGFIWIGTNGGLNKFDGYDFQVQKFEVLDNGGTQSSIISGILEIGNRKMWIGTHDDGIYLADLKTESLIKIRQKYPKILTSIVGQFVTDAHNNTWFVHRDGITVLANGLNGKTPKTKRFLYKGLNRPVQVVKKGPNNLMWVGMKSGLYSSNSYESVEEIKLKRVGEQKHVRDISVSPWGIIVAYYDGIKVYNGDTTYQISGTNTGKLLLGSDNTLWCAREDGLVSYKIIIIKGKIKLSQKTSHVTSNNQITALLEDKTGLIWVGTQSGLDVVNPNKKKFRHFKHKTEEPGSISHNAIRSIYEDKYDNLWIGTDGNGASILPHSDSKNYANGFYHFKWDKSSIEDYVVYSFCEPQNEEIWLGVGYHSKSVAVSLSEKTDFQRLDHYRQDDFNGFAITQQLVDSHKNIWLATHGGGLVRLRKKGSEYAISVFTPKGESSVSSYVIRSLYEDKKGNIWIGTDNGLNKVLSSQKDKDNPIYEVFKHLPQDTTSLSHNYIMPIYQAKNGILWIGTFGGGLNKLYYDKNGKEQFLSYGIREGFPNDIIKGILEDEKGNLWISSNKGLTCFNPVTEEVHNYDVSDGLQDFEFGEMACVKRKDGEMLFGGVNGINVFYPNEIKNDTSRISLSFTDFKLSYNSIKPGQEVNGRVLLKEPIGYTQSINLKHNENSFSVEFTGLNFVAPRKNHYKYKLEGFDSDWVTTSSSFRIAKYTNLRPGDYILKVNASNNDGFWNSKPIKLAIKISPPFWQHPLAYLTYVLLSLFLIYLFTQYSLIQNKNKSQLIMTEFEREKVNELAKLKLDFFTNISHEFRTPLTLIMGSIESILSDNSINSKKHNQSKYVIKRNVNTILRLIRQLSDFRKHEQGKLELAVTEIDIVSFTRQVFISFENIAKSKEINFSFETQKDQLLMWFDADKMEKVLFNLISNALKFTPKNGKVDLALSESSTSVTIKVIDSGIGIPLERQKYIFKPFYRANKLKNMGTGIGLSFSKKMVEMHSGKLFLQNKVTSGSTFIMVLQKGNDHFAPSEIMNTDLDFNENLTKNSEWLAPLEEASQEHIVTNNPKKSHTLLVVDDNISLRNLMRRALGTSYFIKEAADGKEALEVCKNVVPDLIISDIMMPEMDGYELCKAVKSDISTSHIPIILLTAKTSEESQIAGFDSGADGYVEKPFSMSVIKARIEALIDSRNKLRATFQNSILIEPKEISTNNKDAKFLEGLLEIINNNLDNAEFTTQQLIQEYGSNRITVNNKLKSMVGCAANSFIRKVRLKKAAELLKESEYNISEITYMVGFQDKAYFRRCFKSEFGVTPSGYQSNG